MSQHQLVLMVESVLGSLSEAQQKPDAVLCRAVVFWLSGASSSSLILKSDYITGQKQRVNTAGLRLLPHPSWASPPPSGAPSPPLIFPCIKPEHSCTDRQAPSHFWSGSWFLWSEETQVHHWWLLRLTKSWWWYWCSTDQHHLQVLAPWKTVRFWSSWWLLHH